MRRMPTDSSHKAWSVLRRLRMPGNVTIRSSNKSTDEAFSLSKGTMVRGTIMTESNLYPFDAAEVAVSFNARPGADNPVIVSHKLRKPTLMELVARDRDVNLEIVEISPREEQIVTDDEAANARLWDKLILSVKGYAGNAQWAEIPDGDKAGVRTGHKTTAIKAMYIGDCSIVGDVDSEVSLTSDTWVIRQSIGDVDNPQFVIDHTLREPTESERIQFKRSASKVSFIRGGKKTRTRIGQDLTAFVKMYDLLVEGIIGGSVNGVEYAPSNRQAFLAAIDPTWKRLIVQTLMNAIEAALLD